MLRIRLQRVGRKHEPTFRLVLTESTNSTKSGRFQEVLGSYDPRTHKPQFNVERIKEWMSKGARVTDTVHNLLINEKIISGKKINVLPLKTPIKKDGPAAAAPQAAAVAPKAEPVAVAEEAPVEEVKAETPEVEAPIA